MLTCRWCGFSGSEEEFEFHPDNSGFWCDCNGFTFLNPQEHEKRRMLLLLEDKQLVSTYNSTVNFPRTNLRKRLSPLRYPGGKSKLIDYLYDNHPLARELYPLAQQEVVGRRYSI